jgi:plastocyanin
MRLRLLPLPLALLVILAAPASARDWTVDVTRQSTFDPKRQSIDPGDKVIWNFIGSGHTTTSNSGQAESWNSNLKSSGTFEHVFDTPGKYQYFCRPHRSFMKGTITVGRDSVGNTLEDVATERSGDRVTVSFRLTEPATVKFRVTGERTVKRGRLRTGKHSIRVGNLDTGSYTGRLIATDDFDKRDSVKRSFVIR